jgi:hypothetical protein
MVEAHDVIASLVHLLILHVAHARHGRSRSGFVFLMVRFEYENDQEYGHHSKRDSKRTSDFHFDFFSLFFWLKLI